MNSKNMNDTQILKKISFVLFSAIFACFLVSCDDDSSLGMEVQPPTDQLGVNFTDTLTLKTYIEKEDSVRSDETSQNLLGFINDPVFGTTSASFVSQFAMPTYNNLTFAGATVDSVVLSLAYYGIYGDSSSTYTMNVYELLESLDVDNNYYSNQSFQHSSTNLANVTFTPNLKDSVKVGSSKKEAHLRIKLDNSIGEKIIAAAGTSDLQSDAAFKNFFKGLAIDAQLLSGSGSMIYFNLMATSKLSALTIYYKGSDNVTKYEYSFYPDATCERVNKFSHNYTGATAINNQLANSDLGQATNGLCYIQPMSGIKTKITFPWINKLKESGNYIINKAELIINVDETAQDETNHPVPPRLVILQNQSDGSISFIRDQFEGDTYIDGYYNSTTKQYHFNIARHFQELLNNRTDYGLYLMVSGASVKANRLIIKGGGNTSGRMKLNISYTKID